MPWKRGYGCRVQSPFPTSASAIQSTERRLRGKCVPNQAMGSTMQLLEPIKKNGRQQEGLPSLHSFQLIHSLTKADGFLGINDTQIVKPKIPSERCSFSCRKRQCSPRMSKLKFNIRWNKIDLWTINCNAYFSKFLDIAPGTKPFQKEAIVFHNFMEGSLKKCNLQNIDDLIFSALLIP